jgi:hypothetical protein
MRKDVSKRHSFRPRRHEREAREKTTSSQHGSFPETGSGTGSTLLVAVPGAEDIVGGMRRRLDPSYAAMPAHITLLYPFVPASSISPLLADKLRELLDRFEPFEFALSEVAWFGNQVVYLAPSPRAPFVELTSFICAGFPEYPPYGGAFDEVVPHLLVGEGARPARMRRAARRLEPYLPIRGFAAEVLLMAPGASGHWEVRETFPLGGACR